MVRVPKWFPGAAWKSFAETGRILANDMVNIPFDITVKSMVNTLHLSKYSHITNITPLFKEAGTNEPSFTSMNLEKNEDPDIVKWCSGTMLSG